MGRAAGDTAATAIPHNHFTRSLLRMTVLPVETHGRGVLGGTHVGWVEPPGRPLAGPMTNSAKPITAMRTGQDGFRVAQPILRAVPQNTRAVSRYILRALLKRAPPDSARAPCLPPGRPKIRK